MHFHNTAWNALVYGRKLWFVTPPHHKVMSNSQILQFAEEELEELVKSGVHVSRCVQRQGDVMIVPENWGHGVLNLQDSIAVATEVRFNLFRLANVPSVVRATDPRHQAKQQHGAADQEPPRRPHAARA